MGILDGKRLLITGVLTDASIAFRVAQVAQQEGATVVLTSFGRQMRITQAISRRLPQPAPVVELDVSKQEDLDALEGRVREHVDGLDGVVHSIAYGNPETLLGGKFMTGPWEDVAQAVQVSAYSLKSLAVATRPLMQRGGSIVGLTFDATTAWPAYDWMGVAKAALESSVRYLAEDLGRDGVRVNAISAGTIKTLAASGIGDFRYIMKWNELNSPLRRNVTQAEVGKAALYLLSDLGSGVTGEVLHVDAGYHVVGMKAVDAPDIDVATGRREG